MTAAAVSLKQAGWRTPLPLYRAVRPSPCQVINGPDRAGRLLAHVRQIPVRAHTAEEHLRGQPSKCVAIENK